MPPSFPGTSSGWLLRHHESSDLPRKRTLNVGIVSAASRSGKRVFWTPVQIMFLGGQDKPEAPPQPRAHLAIWASTRLIRPGAAHALSPDVRVGPPGLRSLHVRFASPSMAALAPIARSMARAAPCLPAFCSEPVWRGFGLPVPQEPALLGHRSATGGLVGAGMDAAADALRLAQAHPSERSPGWAQRTSGDGVWVARSRVGRVGQKKRQARRAG